MPPDLYRPRRRSRRDDHVTFTVTLDGVDLIRWHALAQQQGISLEQLVRESVELAIARGSSR